MKKIISIFLFLGLSINVFGQEFNEQEILKYVKILSHDFLEGRKTGTKGNETARKLIEEFFKKNNLKNFNITKSFVHPFAFAEDKQGANVLGFIPGSKNPDNYIVISAHFDHLGKSDDGKIFHGADDNASGVGGLMASIEYFSKNLPETSLLFAAFDAEEQGLQGSKSFVNNPPVPLSKILMNINLDMISRNEKKELNACGTSYSPFLKKFIESCCLNKEGAKLVFGHDTPDKTTPANDWTEASDHGPFYRKTIPFIYFGVEDHQDYHKTTDTYENIDQKFYLASIKLVITATTAFDKNAEEIKTLSARP